MIFLFSSLHNLLETSTPDNENYKRSAIERLNQAIIILCKQIKEAKDKLDAANQELVSLQRMVSKRFFNAPQKPALHDK